MKVRKTFNVAPFQDKKKENLLFSTFLIFRVRWKNINIYNMLYVVRIIEKIYFQIKFKKKRLCRRM